MENTQAINAEKVQNQDAEKDPLVKALIKAFWVLLAVTILEIGLALLHYELNFLHRTVLNMIFIILTIVKAFYIVAEFMHFRHEKKSLVLIILLPLVFLLWGIGATMWEGAATKDARNDVDQIIHSTTAWEEASTQPVKP